MGLIFKVPALKRYPRDLYRVRTGDGRNYVYFDTEKEAREHAKYAIRVGATKACVDVAPPSGTFVQIACMRRRKRR
jgi:hypothetical protein